jgi:hypothetical protein
MPIKSASDTTGEAMKRAVDGNKKPVVKNYRLLYDKR